MPSTRSTDKPAATTTAPRVSLSTSNDDTPLTLAMMKQLLADVDLSHDAKLDNKLDSKFIPINDSLQSINDNITTHDSSV